LPGFGLVLCASLAFADNYPPVACIRLR